MTRTQQDRITAAVVALTTVAVVAIAWVTIDRRNDYRDACSAAGGVVVKASRAHRICIDRDSVIEVRR